MNSLNTSSEVDKKAFEQLSGVLERMYYDVKKGVSDLRPYERQIKAIFRKRQDYETHQSEIKGRINALEELPITEIKESNGRRTNCVLSEEIYKAIEINKFVNQMKGKDK